MDSTDRGNAEVCASSQGSSGMANVALMAPSIGTLLGRISALKNNVAKGDDLNGTLMDVMKVLRQELVVLRNIVVLVKW